MECLVEIYDREQINNIFVVLSFRPRKVVIMYDFKDSILRDIKRVEKACKLKVKDIKFEYAAINSQNIDNVNRKCKKIIHDNPDCYFDITGGSEMFAIGAYLACTATFTPMFKIDLKECKLINIYGCKYLEEIFSIPRMSLDVVLATHGVSVGGCAHPTPTADLEENILKFCDEVFKDIKKWKDLCLYIQMGNSSFSTEHNHMQFLAPKVISSQNGNVKLEDMSLLKLAENLGFIKNLYFKSQKEQVGFLFKNGTIKKYMTDFGTWLELYTYINLKKSKCFDDVRLSVKIDWDTGNAGFNSVTNEVDVTFFYGIRPVFVSCKLSEPSSEALQELSVYSNYFGGRYSKCILVTLANINKEKSPIFRRAKDMKINIVDGKSIRSGNFINDINKILKVKY